MSDEYDPFENLPTPLEGPLVLTDEQRRALEETRRLMLIWFDFECRAGVHDEFLAMYEENPERPPPQLLDMIKVAVIEHDRDIPWLFETWDNRYTDACIDMITMALGDGPPPAGE